MSDRIAGDGTISGVRIKVFSTRDWKATSEALADKLREYDAKHLEWARKIMQIIDDMDMIIDGVQRDELTALAEEMKK